MVSPTKEQLAALHGEFEKLARLTPESFEAREARRGEAWRAAFHKWIDAVTPDVLNGVFVSLRGGEAIGLLLVEADIAETSLNDDREDFDDLWDELPVDTKGLLVGKTIHDGGLVAGTTVEDVEEIKRLFLSALRKDEGESNDD
jgi:hypothetical protein